MRRATGLACLLLTTPALAGPLTDDLSRCLIESASAGDRAGLVRWLFVAASAHPAVTAQAHVTVAERDAANKEMGQLITRLLTDACREQAKKAIKADGTGAIQQSFQTLGQAAMGDLYSNPAVSTDMDGVGRYIDSKKIDELQK